MNKKIAFHPSKNYIIGGILYGMNLELPDDKIKFYLQECFHLSEEETDVFFDIVKEHEDVFRQSPKMHFASAPEAILYWYIYKYIDKNVGVNRLKLKDGNGFIGRYDIDCIYNSRKWVIEFDSISQHQSEEAEEKDIKKNLLAMENGYAVIRIRNMDFTKGKLVILRNLPYCINLNGYFMYSKENVIRDNQCLHEMLMEISGNAFDFDYDKDLTTICCMPYYNWKS